MCKFHIFAHVIVCHFLQKTRDRNLSCADVFFCAVVATSTSRNFEVRCSNQKSRRSCCDCVRLRATSIVGALKSHQLRCRTDCLMRSTACVGGTSLATSAWK
jgi:hypothetical protein